MPMNNLGIRYSELVSRQGAQEHTEESVKNSCEQAKTKLAYMGELALTLNNMWLNQLDQGQPENAHDTHYFASVLAPHCGQQATYSHHKLPNARNEPSCHSGGMNRMLVGRLACQR